ncbi:MAG: ATP-binding cassette domain-containing protein [Synergistaceae bacterium]|nr:ATP-binding cassette domain-containing protein [Synergistaceae bacterium]
MTLRVKVRKSLGSFTLDVDFEAENETVGLLGASGCGKTMTLHCVAGILRPDEGRIVLDGTVLFDSERGIDLPPQKRRVGLLFQNYALFPNMTVAKNILTVLALKRKERLLPSLVDRFRLGGLENRYPAQLSGGQQQRAALARIMAGEPGALLLDEPFSALDSFLRWQLEGELLQFLETFGGPALYVSHDRGETYRICARACVMDRGRNERIRPVADIFEFPDTLASSILSGCENHSRAERLGGHLLRAVDWNVNLRCGAGVPDFSPDAFYIGVRASRVRPGGERAGEDEENLFPCLVLRVVEDLSSVLAVLRPVGAEGELSRIRMELPKQKETPRPGDILRVAVAPHDILPLRGRGGFVT